MMIREESSTTEPGAPLARAAQVFEGQLDHTDDGMRDEVENPGLEAPEVDSVEELMQLISTNFDTLPRQLKSVARYVDQYRGNVVVDRISDIARTCGVHPSAVIRFAQRFGFSGFSDFQAIFRQAYTEKSLRPQSYRHRIMKIVKESATDLSGGALAREFIAACQSGLAELKSTLNDEVFDKAIGLLEGAENIYVVGVRRSFPAASYLVYALQHTTKRVHLVSGAGGMLREQVRSVRKDDVVVAISFPPYGRETLYVLRAAQHHGARTIAITDGRLSPLARDANASLLVKEGNAFDFRSLTSTICLCQALCTALGYRLALHPDDYSSEAAGN